MRRAGDFDGEGRPHGRREARREVEGPAQPARRQVDERSPAPRRPHRPVLGRMHPDTVTIVGGARQRERTVPGRDRSAERRYIPAERTGWGSPRTRQRSPRGPKLVLAATEAFARGEWRRRSTGPLGALGGMGVVERRNPRKVRGDGRVCSRGPLASFEGTKGLFEGIGEPSRDFSALEAGPRAGGGQT